MEFIYITNDQQLAQYAQDCGVHRIMVDLEIIGKNERQGHINTVISKHDIADVQKIKSVLNKAKLQVRINPININSEEEINQVIGFGADIIMLPMFTTPVEALKLVSWVNKRATVQLLVETPQALARIDNILAVQGIDEVHIGLNDLHLGLNLKFMFELLSGGIVEYLSEKVNRKGIRFGFGGIARLGQGTVDSSLILSEHYRLKSQMVILSRDFHANATNLNDLRKSLNLKNEIDMINNYLDGLESKSLTELLENKAILKEKVDHISGCKTIL
jgi:hypothetical protein